MSKKFFASDNCSGIHPQIMQAIMEANTGHVKGYGYDNYTNSAELEFKRLFGNDIEVFFVYSGTGANVLGLQACLHPFEAVICSDMAHIHTDETGAPERNLMSKLIPLKSVNGKISVDQISEVLVGRGVEHHAQPKVISLTQSTEYGTLYQPSEIKAFGDFCKKEDLYLHLDGARISNASAALGMSPREFVRESGVDVMSFGGTKNGMMMGEAVVFFKPELAKYMKFQRKQGMQLFSKMRFISAQFSAFFKDDLWLNLAKHSNNLAQHLAKSLREIEGVQITQPVEVNAVFAIFPQGVSEQLAEEFPFYVWNEALNEVRLMCSWDTEIDDIEVFIERAKQLCNGVESVN
jgi:threonine aldolase